MSRRPEDPVHIILMPETIVSTTPLRDTPVRTSDPLEHASDCLLRSGRRLSRGELHNSGEVLTLLRDAALSIEQALRPGKE